jgi:hypothetical protein
MTTRMHPMFVELFLDPPGDLDDEDEARRVRARRARRATRRQVVRASSRGANPPAGAARQRG